MSAATFAVICYSTRLILAGIALMQFRRGGCTQTVLDLAGQVLSHKTMNSQKIGLRVASVLFAIFALLHLLRLLNQVQVIIGGQTIPLWISVLIALIAALLSFWTWKLSRSI